MNLTERVLGDERRQRLLFTAIIAFGILCRLVQYAWRRSFWHDESYLVLNIVSGHFTSVFHRLSHEQAAPPAFLWVQMGVVGLFGTSEYALRLFPLIVGCANVVLMAVLARRVASPLAAIVATALFALSDASIWHVVESKQYTSDVFVALLLWLCATTRWNGDETTPVDRRRLLLAAGVATAGVWVSTPAAFVFGGISLVLLATTPGAFLRSVKGIVTYLLANVAVAGSFFAVYWFSLRLQQSPYLFSYWSEEMMPWGWQLPKWLIVQAWDVFDYPYEKAGAVLLFFAIVAGVVLHRTGGASRRLLWLLVAPALLNLLAAAIHRYPFAGTRLTLYLAPAAMLLPAIAMAWAIERAMYVRWRRLATTASVAAPAALLLFGVVQAGYSLFVPRHRGHIRPAAEYVQSHRSAEEKVYVLSESEPLQCYWRDDADNAEESTVELEPEDADEIRDERFWVVYSFANERGRRRPRAAVNELARHANVEAQFDAIGSSAVHFVRKRKDPATAPALTRVVP